MTRESKLYPVIGPLIPQYPLPNQWIRLSRHADLRLDWSNKRAGTLNHLNESNHVSVAGAYDVIVVGGGIAGVSAALWMMNSIKPS